MRRPSFTWLSPTISSIGERFGFDAHYFAKNIFVVSAGYALNVLRGIVTGYLVTRIFPAEMYGEYRFMLSVIGMLTILSLPGLPSALGSAIANKQSVPLKNLMEKYAYLNLIGTVVLLACIPFLQIWGRMELWPHFLIAAILFVPNNVSTMFFGSVVRGTGKFSDVFRVSLISSIVLTLIITAVIFLRPSSLLLFTLMIAIPSIVYLIPLKKYLKKFNDSGSPWPILKNSISLSVATIPVSVSWYVDGLLLSAFFGLKELALFSVAMLIPEQIKTWTKELFPIVFSKQAKGNDTQERRRKMHIAVFTGTLVFGAGILCYMLITPYIIPFLFPKYPASSLIVLTNVSALTLIVAPATLYPQYLEARGMIRQVQWTNIISAIVFVLALFILIPRYGPLGAILARGLFRLCNAIIPFVLILGIAPSNDETQRTQVI